MSDDNAHAAGEGGTVTVLAPLSQDEIHRQSAVDALAGFLARGSVLLARCEALAKVQRGDRLGAIAAAARLMNANAQVARALAHVALVESRRRLIVETIQPPKPENAELNSRKFSTTDDDSERAELARRIDRIVQTETAEQERLAGLAIGSCI